MATEISAPSRLRLRARLSATPDTAPRTAPAAGGTGMALASVVGASAVLSSPYTMTKLALRNVPPLTI